MNIKKNSPLVEITLTVEIFTKMGSFKKGTVTVSVPENTIHLFQYQEFKYTEEDFEQIIKNGNGKYLIGNPK